ncbi:MULTISPECIES: pyruvate formate-lyase-activating protein [Streptomyces]|uniref:Pyruvate formate-lyase-activating enzyme n=3 Tax=Streptomyces griseoaurantiacus TaxID=68213 RepID=F3NK07_9ACTN|nr:MULTISPECIES: pyruvate formate-lyase-activating protein [Streptomyces]EGG46418.1 oxidoreductase [Streptomyces griseoaurantiacus M045]MBA5220093.1 pyruvate formate lyase-activating protein [Streptomyces griseoaurantiacus]MDX3090494.1 pyruvate formate-lyase-activating protein [Streptomyces sp. ME12-02E]MDX3333866.1 pyruvate formate-lyase-activating protein [Streptomyces sp. ME02-6978a]WTI30101.1 pyruvate formate-lyase-activating protein [Streptomyces jietaisiensis]
MSTVAAPPVTGRVHSWDLSTGVDGPGTRFVLFLSGCPLRCLYCANPDTWHMRDGRTATVDEIMAEIEKYRPFLTASGGGVTLTGGEALLQPAFTGALLRRCKEAGLHTALDTSGFLGARASDALLADTDLVLLDIKSFDIGTYRRLTGGDLAPTLAFATRLNRLGVPLWIRYVLVPGWTDDLTAVDGLAEFVAGLDTVDRVDVLPFHKLGAPKYEALGIPFPLKDTPTPDPALTERVRARFRAHGTAAY